METNNEIQEINLKIKRGFLDSKKRHLIINPEYIQFEDTDLLATPFTRFEKDEIDAYRFGINWLRGFEFTIGREYQIYILNKNNQTLKINFRSLYGIKKKELHKLYSDIIDALWEFYFNDIINNLLEKFRNDELIEVGKAQISIDGITIRANGIFKEQMKTIPWKEVGTKDYYTYFNIHSTQDTANINRGYSYMRDWNTGVLYSIVKIILREKKLLASLEKLK